MYFTEQSGTSSDPELGYILEPAKTPVTLKTGLLTLKQGILTIT